MSEYSDQTKGEIGLGPNLLKRRTERRDFHPLTFQSYTRQKFGGPQNQSGPTNYTYPASCVHLERRLWKFENRSAVHDIICVLLGSKEPATGYGIHSIRGYLP